jgi:hypothetical protein
MTELLRRWGAGPEWFWKHLTLVGFVLHDKALDQARRDGEAEAEADAA